MFGTVPGAGDVATRAADQLGRLPPAARLRLAASETAEVRLPMKIYTF